MTEKIAPASLTGGAGYGFEDQVAAWFLVHLLCGEAPLEPEFGAPVTVDFQVRESGWLLDDLLITCKGSQETERRLAVSVKRDRQVTRSGFPSDFVAAVWQQWVGLNISKNPFQREHDLLCLATGRLADSVESAWDEILQQALGTVPVRLAKRLTTPGSSNAIQRALFSSLQCPQSLAQSAGADAGSAATLLSHLRLMRFDFRSPTSRDSQDAIRRCQSCLRQGSLTEATQLWGDLVAIAADLRVRGGSINLRQLLRRLAQYHLREYADYRADWDALQALTCEAMAIIRTQLGPEITLQRDPTVEEILGRLESLGMVVLLGESGTGKSALAKSIACGQSFQQVVWLNGQHLDRQGLSSASRLFGLIHSMTEVLSAVGVQRALLVLDSLESFSPDALRNATELIKVIEPGCRSSRWRVLMTSQPMGWERVQLQLQMDGLSLPGGSVFSVEAPDIVTLVSVTRSLPDLSALILQPQLGELLRNLKTLDWVAGTLRGRVGIGQEWTGLSDIIDAVWSWWIQSDSQRYVRDGVLKAVGVKEAESFSGVVSLDRFGTLERQVLGELEEKRLLNVREGKVSFTHSLLGDWSRLQTLVGIAESRVTDELRRRAENPRWHAAIRLYGQRGLERARNGSTWYHLVQHLDDGSIAGRLAADLVLEAAALAHNARHTLPLVWPHLVADQGRLLVRLLRRFRHSATFSDPAAAAMTPDQDIAIWLASTMRIPMWPSWGPMLELLYAHADEIKGLALASASELCHLWLSTMPARTRDGKPFAWRRQAAELSLILARELQDLLAEGIAKDQASEWVYKAFLSAAPDLPELVSALALELAKRRPPASEIQERTRESEKPCIRRQEERTPEARDDDTALYGGMIPSMLGQLSEPWPAGPTEQVDQVFRAVCLEKQALHPLMATRPAIAKEIILALCIEPPQPEVYRGDPFLGMKYGTSGDGAQEAFFAGPFLAFLQIDAELAIESIIELVDFATERWQDWVQAKDGIRADPEVGEDQSVEIWVQGRKRKLIGDSRVLGWHRGRLIDAPYVVSGLMALEKWLYDKTEAGDDVSEWVDIMLEKTRSIAVIGVLVALGKKHPELLLGCLRPILSIWQVYQWDWVVAQDDAMGVPGISLLLWSGLGETTFNIVRDWQVMPHRKIYFRDLVIQLLLGEPELREHFGEIRETWRGVLETTAARSGSLEFLIERFDPANYVLAEDEHGRLVALLQFPERLTGESQASMRSRSYSLALFSFPRKCRELIDSGKRLDSDELAHFWQGLQDLVDEYDEKRTSIGYLNNAVMAGIAALAILHEEWLEAEEERADWCARQIERILGTEQGREVHDMPGSAYEFRWQVFLGELAVHLLAQDPGNEETRLLAAQSILAYHYDTTRVLCRTAYRLRGKLGDEFGRLLNLCRLWAGIRHGMDWCSYHHVSTARLQSWYDSAMTSFVQGDLEPAPIPLKEIGGRSESLIFEALREHQLGTREAASADGLLMRYLTSEEVPRRSHLGLDWQAVQASYAWLPPLTAASNKQERAAWIAIHGELLQLELIYLRTAHRNRWGEVDGTPYEFEYWILEMIAGLIPQLQPPESPEKFWQPILDLGANAHYWVDSFLSRWFISGSKMASEPATFATHWRAMIEYVLASRLWSNDPSTPGRFRLEDLHITLMGLGLGGAILEQEEYTDVVTSLLPLYKRWAEQWLGCTRVAEAFARFLIKPSARKLVLSGLAWLAQAIARIPERGWDRSRLPNALLLLLVTCWRNHLPELEGDHEIKKAFLEVLNALVAREHAGALELRDVILR